MRTQAKELSDLTKMIRKSKKHLGIKKKTEEPKTRNVKVYNTATQFASQKSEKFSHLQDIMTQIGMRTGGEVMSPKAKPGTFR